MRYLFLTLKNVKKFMVYHPVMFIFLLTVQIVCMIVVFITSGMAYNMNYVEKEKEYKNFGYSFIETNDLVSYNHDLLDDGTIEKYYSKNGQNEKLDHVEVPAAILLSEFRPLFEEFTEKIGDLKDRISVVLFVYPGKKVDISMNLGTTEFKTYVPGFLNEKSAEDKRLFSDEKIIFAPLYTPDGKENWLNDFRLGEAFKYYGTEYKCVGNYTHEYMPYKAMPDEFAVHGVNIPCDSFMSADEINRINEAFCDTFNQKITESKKPEPYNPDAMQFTQIMFVISAVMMAIVLFAIAKFYHFILGERKENLAVLRLCGCSREKVHVIYMLEIILTMAFTTSIGFAVFRFLLFKPIASLYPSFDEFFIPSVYIVIIAVYFALSMIILSVSIIPITKTTVADMKRMA